MSLCTFWLDLSTIYAALKLNNAIKCKYYILITFYILHKCLWFSWYFFFVVVAVCLWFFRFVYYFHFLILFCFFFVRICSSFISLLRILFAWPYLVAGVYVYRWICYHFHWREDRISHRTMNASYRKPLRYHFECENIFKQILVRP